MMSPGQSNVAADEAAQGGEHPSVSVAPDGRAPVPGPVCIHYMSPIPGQRAGRPGRGAGKLGKAVVFREKKNT